MTAFFDKVRGAPSTYVDSNDGMLADVRLVIYRHGEDPSLVIAGFWEEHPNENFSIIPLPAYGNAPRRELCSSKSLTEALRTVSIEANSVVEQHWRTVCEHHLVQWPKRLQAA